MSALNALKAAAAGDDDGEDDYSDDGFDAHEPAPTVAAPEKKTAAELLAPQMATSPTAASRGRGRGSGKKSAGGARSAPSGLRGSVAELSSKSNAEREKLMRTSLPAFMKANVSRKKSKKDKDKKKAEVKFTTSRMNALSQPKAVKPAKFSRESDAKHCRFKPRISKASRAMVEESEDPDAFIYKAEAKQLAHTRDLERRRAEEAYNARVDKKECPRCHVPQSYAEVHSKTKKCERCNLFYRPKKSWSDVQDSFLKRLEDGQAEKVANLMETARRVEMEESKVVKKVYDPETGTIKRVKPKKKNWKAVRAQFLERMEEDAKKKQEKKDLLLRTVAAMDKECTFMPKSKDVGTFEERMEADLQRRRERLSQTAELFSRPPEYKQRAAATAVSVLMRGVAKRRGRRRQ